MDKKKLAKLIIVDDKTIQLDNFQFIKNNMVVFTFTPTGISIFPNKKNLTHYCFPVTVENNQISNPRLVQMLQNRGLTKEQTFYYLEPAYTELTPHPKSN